MLANSLNILKLNNRIVLTLSSGLRTVKAEKTAPIVNKNELDNVQPDDVRHYRDVVASNGFESNAIFYNQRLDKFIKTMMREGKYALCRSQLEKTFYHIKLKQIEKYNKAKTDEERADIETNPQRVFDKALDNCKPLLKMTTINRGGIGYQVPMPMPEKEREFAAIKNIIESSNEKDKDFRFYENLAIELINASMNQGKSIKKKIDVHRLAEANRAYAHFRWIK